MNLELLSAEDLLNTAKKLIEANTALEEDKNNLSEKNTSLEEAIVELKEKISSMEGIIAAGSKASDILKTEKNEAPKIPADPIEFGGKKYQWTRPTFRIPGNHTVWTAEQASTDETVLKQLLAITGQEVLKELV